MPLGHQRSQPLGRQATSGPGFSIGAVELGRYGLARFARRFWGFCHLFFCRTPGFSNTFGGFARLQVFHGDAEGLHFRLNITHGCRKLFRLNIGSLLLQLFDLALDINQISH